jgi:hypothetical protein
MAAGILFGLFAVSGCEQAQQVVEKTTQTMGEGSSNKNNYGDKQ